MGGSPLLYSLGSRRSLRAFLLHSLFGLVHGIVRLLEQPLRLLWHSVRPGEADGGGKASKFFHVTLPGLRGQIDLCLFSTLINYLNLYGQPSVIRGSTIYDTMFDSPMMLIQYSLKALPRWTGFICAMAVVFGLIVLAVSIAEKRLMNKQKGGHGYEKTFAAYKSVQK